MYVHQTIIQHIFFKNIMASSLDYSLSLTITLCIFLAVSLSNGEDKYDHYEACSIKYSCGNVKNVGYPFWGDNRPKFCGLPNLKLTCKQESDGILPVIDLDHGNNYYQVKVLSINTSSHTMVLRRRRSIMEECSRDDKLVTLLPELKPDTGYKMMELFYDCSNNTCVAKNSSRTFPCSGKNITQANATYYVDHPSDMSKCSCKTNSTFLVEKRGLDELISHASTTVLNNSTIFRTKYEAKFTVCSKCEDSGGRCGSSEGESILINKFVCYCKDGPSQGEVCYAKSDQKKMLKKVLGSGAGVMIVFAAAIVGIWLCKRQNSKSVDRRPSLECSVSDLERGSRYFGVPLFSYRELAEATNNFDESEELGNGGFGIVYHGRLKDGREVAVKRLYEKNYKRIEQFMNEISILTRLRHHNLVSLYGCTSQHCRELLLVYEYVNNGTVADHLFSKNTTSRLSPLSWPVRLRIAIETAAALSYLHASDIIHRDVKTNNILLDSNFCVKVADFGLSRLFPTDVTHVSTAPQGTPGYVDPEYHQCYQLTDKSDVYSFGVVLIELISSLPAIDMDRHRNEINLSNYAINRIRQCAFEELVDPQLGFATDFKVRRMTISVAELAFQCLQHDKEFRPSMDEVLEVLKKIEGADYEALLQAEQISEKAGEEVKLHCSNLPPPPSPTENDHKQLLRNHQPHPPSPISVIEKWTSRSTSSSNSK